jgi:hypothetical protein
VNLAGHLASQIAEVNRISRALHVNSQLFLSLVLYELRTQLLRMHIDTFNAVLKPAALQLHHLDSLLAAELSKDGDPDIIRSECTVRVDLYSQAAVKTDLITR